MPLGFGPRRAPGADCALVHRAVSGDGDAEDARRVGFHRFEQFVRHGFSVASEWPFSRPVLAMVVVECAPTFDMLWGFTTQHAVTFIAMTIMSPIIVPEAVRLLAERPRRHRAPALRLPAVAAYGVGVLLNLFGAMVDVGGAGGLRPSVQVPR